MSSVTQQTTCLASTQTSVKVVCYNLLSSDLASPKHFSKCDPIHLERSVRLQRLLQKIESELPPSMETSSDMIDDSTTPVIFALQEVSHDWVGPLYTFFAKRGYMLVTALYGKRFNGYMGIATAYPMDQFEALEVDIHRLSDKREGGWPRPPLTSEDETTISTRLRSVISNLTQKLIPPIFRNSADNSSKSELNPWERSEYRSNEIIAIRLQKKTRDTDNDDQEPKPFLIGNYHMPCAFREPAVMTIHAEMVARRIQQLAKGQDYILAGDFNILPDTPHYHLLTKGVLEPANSCVDVDDDTPTTTTTTTTAPAIHYPPIFHNVEWKSNIDGMRSAYADHRNQEPDFTNYAFVGDQEEAFVGTLDYIFLSKNWKVIDTKSLPSREEVVTVDNPSFPNQEEPSDHLLISATLEL